MDVKETVKEIVGLVGGPDNINTVSHCLTRLRFRVKDRSKVEDEKIKSLASVMGIIEAGGQIQVIIGTKVPEYYLAATELYPELKGIGEVAPDEVADKPKTFMDKVVDLATDLFIPCVSLLAGCGTLQGLLALFVFLGWLDSTSSTYTILYLISNSIFYYFPVLVAYNTGKHFGGKPFFSAIAVLIMIHPTILDAVNNGTAMDLFGIPLTLVDYSSAVFPAIIVAWFATVIEKFVRKFIPSMVQMVFVPMIVLLIAVPAGLLIIGPVMTAVMNAITAGAMWLVEFSPVVAGLVVGAVWQPLVFLGISKAFVPVFIADLTAYGYDALIPITFIICALAQGAAALAFALHCGDPEKRQIGVSSFIACLFGITEPAMFGLNVPEKRPFIMGVIAAAIGGLISAVLGGKGYSIAAGVLGIPILISPNGIDFGFWGAIIGCVVAFVLAFALTWFLGDGKKAETAGDSKTVVAGSTLNA